MIIESSGRLLNLKIRYLAIINLTGYQVNGQLTGRLVITGMVITI
jgi:hypothetical protein